MNTPEQRSVESSDAYLRSHFQALQRQNNFLLTGLVVLSLILMGYLFIQSRRAGKDLKQVQMQVQRVTKANQEREKRLREAMTTLSQFSATNEEFRKIFAVNEQAIIDFLNRRTNAPGTDTP